jgi:hypothetical protein
MKLPTLNRVAITLLAAGVFAPNLYADWGSLHGSNHSAPAPSFAPHPQAPVNRAPQPMIRPSPQPVIHSDPRPVDRPPETRQAVQPEREVPHQVIRTVDRVENHPVVVDRTPARETDRRRMDIDEDRRQTFFWSGYHSGMRIDRLPDGYRRFRVRDHDFFYFGGVYYDSGPSGYVVCAPPVDADIPELPPGTETIQAGDTIYYYAAGAFYVQQPDGSFVVVAAPLGVTVAMLPPDATSVVVNGVGYFQADGNYYQPVMQNGVTVYLTVPQP